jgi:hypothetical protein
MLLFLQDLVQPVHPWVNVSRVSLHCDCLQGALPYWVAACEVEHVTALESLHDMDSALLSDQASAVTGHALRRP